MHPLTTEALQLQKFVTKLDFDPETNAVDEKSFDDLSVDHQSVEEATGNEGATMERWYRTAVLLFFPRDLGVELLPSPQLEGALAGLQKGAHFHLRPQNMPAVSSSRF